MSARAIAAAAASRRTRSANVASVVLKCKLLSSRSRGDHGGDAVPVKEGGPRARQRRARGPRHTMTASTSFLGATSGETRAGGALNDRRGGGGGGGGKTGRLLCACAASEKTTCGRDRDEGGCERDAVIGVTGNGRAGDEEGTRKENPCSGLIDG